MSPSDYQFVNISQVGDSIHGNILPVRFTNSQTQGVATCTYEDYLFLLEAYYERANYDQVGQNNITPSPRTVIATAAEATTFYKWNYINKDSVIPTGIVEFTQGRLQDVVTNKDFTLAAQKYGQYFIRSKNTRSLEGWCRRFYDVTQMSRIMNYSSHLVLDLFNSSGYKRYEVSYGMPDIHETTHSNMSPQYIYKVGGGSGGSELLIVPYDVQYKSTIYQNYQNAKAATCIVEAYAQYDDRPAHEITRYFAKPLTMTVSNGSISLPSGWAETFIEDVAGIIGKTTYSYPQAQKDSDGNYQMPVGTEGNQMRIYITNYCTVIDFDFPANFTNWNWQPSS